MEIDGLGCCAFNEIKDLSDEESAEDAMNTFCQVVNEQFYDKGEFKYVLNPGAFYLFTAVVKYGTTPASHRYGDDFAAYIKEHKLGVVKETMTRLNRANEPTHLVKGWVWAPSVKGLQTWWDKRKAGTRGN